MASSSAAADSTPDTLVQAAAVGRAVFDSVVSSDQLKTPRLRNIQRAPTSFADAQAAIHARDEEHRRLEAQRKEASKSKSTPEPQGPPNPNPGVSIGSVQEASAFWLFVVSGQQDGEARRGSAAAVSVCAESNHTICTLFAIAQNDYYRDVGYDDLAFLVPPCRDISQDDAFYVPPLGRNKLAAPKGGLSARNKAPSKSSQLFVPDTATDDPEVRTRTTHHPPLSADPQDSSRRHCRHQQSRKHTYVRLCVLACSCVFAAGLQRPTQRLPRRQ